MPSWDSILTFSFGWLVGAFMGAASKYLADKYTDQRRNQESQRGAAATLREVEGLMPDLLARLRAGVKDSPTTRSCVLLPQVGVQFSSRERHFMLYETDIPNLREKLSLLKNHGYVQERFGLNVPAFVLTETFVAALRAE
jgi:hypothetical protein